MKLRLYLLIVVLALACNIEGRYVSHRTRHDDSEDSVVSVDGRHPHPVSVRGLSPKQARVFPGAVAIKKLVLLKFKKIIPISLILLKSSNDNEAELVPVYPTSEIPSNVQFIPTPNGISGHKDVQAIAIPTELHHQLEMNGLANLENIEALLNQAEENQNSGESSVTIVQQMQEDDVPLNIKDDDEEQLLEGVSVDTPVKASASAVAGVRRLAADDILKPGLRGSSQHTAIEEIPLYLYSTKDTSQMVYNSHRKPNERYIALRRQHAS